MIETPVIHGSFTLERTYPAALQRVFGAWSTPAAKARWFSTPESEHSLDFRIGGVETATGTSPEGNRLVFRSIYHHIIPDQRIVYGSTLSADGVVITVSVTTVEFAEHGDGTRLTLTESAAFLDGKEKPEWRENGSAGQLDALALQLEQD